MTPPPLIGNYPAPRVRLGRKLWCEYRGEWCRVTSYTEAPVPWPRVQPLKQRGGAGLWVNATLKRAVRTESAVALKHWFGLSQTTSNALRRWAGVVGHDTTPGTRRAMKTASELAAEVTRGSELSDEACELRAKNSRRLKLIGFAQAKRWQNGWTPKMDALLGTLPDKVLAKRLGKSRSAVRSRRNKLGIQPA